jgi:hypothetical protein
VGELVPLAHGRVKSLLEEALNEVLHIRLEKAYFSAHFREADPRESRSWQHSLKELLQALDDAGLGECEVLLEHSLPRSSLRVDAIVCGHNPDNGCPSYVFVELKQWSHVHAKEGRLIRQNPKDQLRPHPSDQVRGYCHFVHHAVPSLAEQKELVSGVAYLHNARRQNVLPLLGHPADHWGRTYTLDERPKFLARLKGLLDVGRSHHENAAMAEKFLDYPTRPSAQLLEIAQDSLERRTLLPLVDQQQAAFEAVKNALVDANRGSRKKVVIVVGGPGSGKSAIALSLLGDLRGIGIGGYHSTGSKAFTETLRKYVDPGTPRVADVFRYNNKFGDDKPHSLDVIISDEAQRLRESSTPSGAPNQATENSEPQIKELIVAARVPVFLLDENQRVRTYEVGTVEEITRIAEQLGCAVEKIDLRGQFRCGGSDAYERWVDRLLGITQEAPVEWSSLQGDDRFQVHVADNPFEMQQWIKERRKPEETGRFTAGFCWPWPKGERAAKPDIKIGKWEWWWNYKVANEHGPEHTYWATDPRGVWQVGCIYTAQGFEYDWAGVIFGEDLVWRRDRWVAQPNKSRDPGVRGDRARFPELVRNAYRVLLTRGMRGVTMFSVDPPTQEHLRAMVGQPRA